jgi:DNA-binding protein HU-beta
MIVPKEQFIQFVVDQFVDKDDAQASSISPRDAEIIVKGVVRALIESMKKGKIRIFGFGSFQGVIKPARNGRNPHTGESIQIPARVGVKFNPSPNLKEILEPFLKADKKKKIKSK